MKYKNLFLAYSTEVIVALLTLIFVTLLGVKAISFLALIALRRFILEREQLLPQNEFWYKSFNLGRNALIVLATIIILLSVFLDIANQYEFILENKDRVLLLILPLYILIHGILGIISLKK